MKRILTLVVVLCFLAIAADNAMAQTKQRVRFAAGATSTTIRSSVRGYSYRDYIVGARAGQTIEVQVTSANTFTIFSIFQPNGDGLGDAFQVDQFSGELPSDGNYVVRVGMMRAGARLPRSIANFTLKISVK